MLTRKIEFGSREHMQSLQLRNEFLRRPAGLPALDFFPEEEKDWQHFVIMNEDGKVVGCVVAVKKSDTMVRLRQMAVHKNYQGQGIGKSLLLFTEKELQKTGFELIVIHARKAAAGFYENSGYKYQGGEFIEVSIPHVAMTKSIKPEQYL